VSTPVPDFTIEQHDPAAVDALRPLWLAMKAHHAEITPDWGPVRGDEDSWARRRADYVNWLAEPDAFCLVARDSSDSAVLGYALVTVNEGSPTWAAVARFAYVESLSVLPQARGRGVGTALLQRVEEHLATLDVFQLDITAVAANSGARRFYERAGYETAFVTLQRRTRRQ
jgi:GNAT superfamily N-acetyltransferase